MGYFFKQSRFSTLIMLLLLAVVLFRTAWICDDAYITMRTVDNFINGYGIVYNLGERVQSFTHPLWLFVISGLYFFTHEAYYTLLFISISLTLTVAFILIQRVATTQATAILGITVLLFSKSFIDYSTSGLENPLSHLLIILFASFFLTMAASIKKLFLMSFIAALGIVNRLDLLLIFLPAVIFTFVEVWKSMLGQRKKILVACAIGFSPLILWLLFALFYYGFFFPNTAYAKLNTGIPKNFLYLQGIGYFLNLFNNDPLTLLIMMWAFVEAVISRNNRKLVIATGIGLYLGYIVYIGGDFMSGRFFTVPFLCAVILLSRSEVITDKNKLFLPLGIVLITGFASPFPPILSTEKYGQNRDNIFDIIGVADERAFYYPTTGLLRMCKGCQIPNSQWIKDGLVARENNNRVEIKKAIGFFGFSAGPEKYISDVFGLADPLLARLPMSDLNQWRVGHYERLLPDGYLETLESGINQISDANLAEFYNHLTLITQGNLTDIQRLIAIWKMNTGQYAYLLPHANNP